MEPDPFDAHENTQLRFAKGNDDGFDRAMFARQLTRVTRLAADRTTAYGGDAAALEQINSA